MTQTTPSPVRASARALAFVVPLLVAVGLAGACAENRRSLGEDCLKSADCLSGVCSQLRCAVPPPTTDTMTQGPGSDATVDGPGEAASGGEGGADSPPDSPSESGNTDAPPDSSGDTGSGGG
jgi:hypothetical protein